METEVVKALTGNGPFVILFFFMLWWVLKTNNEREQKYQDTIDKLAASLKCVESIKEDVEDIKTWLSAPKTPFGGGS